MAAKELYRVGMRVRAREGTPAEVRGKPVRCGNVIGYSRDGDCVRVVWDGLRSAYTLHMDFIEAVQ